MGISMVNITKKQVPTLLTLLRIFLILPILYTLHSVEIPKYWILVLFLLAAATDYLDGHLARKWDAKTDTGAMLDQISDKLLIASVLIVLAVYRIAAPLTVIIIILREIYVSGLREHMGMKRIPVPVSRWGKYKTATQMVAVVVILIGATLDVPRFELFGMMLGGHAQAVLLGNLILIVSAVLGIISAVQYTLAVRRHQTA